MKTYYDVLGVSRHANSETIRAAFCKSVKACHPDLHAGDPTAEQQLRRILAAYELLKKPSQRAAYDHYLKSCRREQWQRMATTAVAGLASGAFVMALVLWLPSTQEASGQPQTPTVAVMEVSEPPRPVVTVVDNRPEVTSSRKSDRVASPALGARAPDDGPPQIQPSATSVHAALRRSQPPSIGERRQPEANVDTGTAQAFADRRPDRSEAARARAKLIALVDAAEDLTLLNVMGLGTGAIAERAQRRLVRLGGALEPEAKEGAPSADSPSLTERAARFVSARVSAWSSGNAADLAALTSVYADQVVYNGSRKSRQAIALEKRRLMERWPERVYDVRPGTVAARCLGTVCKVDGLMDWQTRNAARTTSASGVARFEYEIVLAGGAFRILSESSSTIKPLRQTSACSRKGLAAGGMTTTSATESHDQAARCLQIAKKTLSSGRKGLLLAQAEAWRQRAEEQERIERQVAERWTRAYTRAY